MVATITRNPRRDRPTCSGAMYTSPLLTALWLLALTGEVPDLSWMSERPATLWEC